MTKNITKLNDDEVVEFATEFVGATQSSHKFKICMSDGLLLISVHDDPTYTVSIGYGSVGIHKANLEDLAAERVEGKHDLAADSIKHYEELPASFPAKPLFEKREPPYNIEEVFSDVDFVESTKQDKL